MTTRDTVGTETPARRAISVIVTLPSDAGALSCVVTSPTSVAPFRAPRRNFQESSGRCAAVGRHPGVRVVPESGDYGE
ncbi:hypothetical protein GCM10010269_74810 [Streptomyces humidus]|uniref:Uncharacterized protein n=1 Tax=Streptomyces humidus TaxID=52259 RepID=A0A918G9X0_9ACTN|nr:hypothetical protein GCM10010269_74810 [Streptomyces humidus]